ncbi:MAG: guanylate kinase, partial [Thermodesulfobacteriota bacterium]
MKKKPNSMVKRGKLYVVSAPSGAGKTTLIKRVLNRFKTLSYSVSHTTRAPRNNEQQGLDYFFISQEEFKEKISRDYWLEWAKVHGNYYGTSKDFIKTSLDKGKSLILDIDVQGTSQILQSGLEMVTIFIMPPSIEILSQRLENRGSDSKKVIDKRIKNAKIEIAKKHMYQYVVINDDLDK